MLLLLLSNVKEIAHFSNFSMATIIGNVFERDEREKFVVEWEIQNIFGLLKKIDKVYNSPSFSFDNAYWFLSVYPNGHDLNKSEGFIDLYLFREYSGPPISLECTLGLKTVNGKLDPVKEGTYNFEKPRGFGFPRMLNRHEFSERKYHLAPCNVLTVVCFLKHPTHFKATGLGDATTMECFFCKITLDVRGNISDHMQKCTELPLKCPTCGDIFALKNWYDHKCQMTSEANEKLLNDFKSMMLRGDHSDAVIKVKHEEFRLHKNVLASRNPYFHSMFNCNMKEKNTGNVTIDDCEPDVFRSFIHFVYTGKVDKLTFENVCDLYELADKYQEDQLKNKCLHFMMSEFSVESFCDFTILALKHDEKELLENAIKFFAKNIREIIRSVKWQTLLTEYPIQGNELLIKALN